jgi:hypothetical protein
LAKENGNIRTEDLNTFLESTGMKVNDDKIYELECYLDSDGTFGISFIMLRDCWLSGLRCQNGVYGMVKHVKGALVGFTRRVSESLNKLLANLTEKNDEAEGTEKENEKLGIDLYSESDVNFFLNKIEGEVKTEIGYKLEINTNYCR